MTYKKKEDKLDIKRIKSPQDNDPHKVGPTREKPITEGHTVDKAKENLESSNKSDEINSPGKKIKDRVTRLISPKPLDVQAKAAASGLQNHQRQLKDDDDVSNKKEQKASENVQSKTQEILQTVGGTVNNLKEMGQNVVDNVRQKSSETIETIKNMPSNIAKNLKETVQSTHEKGQETMENIREKGKEYTQAARDKGQETTENIREKGKEYTQAARDKGKEAIENVQEKGKEYTQAARDKGQEASENVQEKGKEYIQSARDKGQEAVGNVQEKGKEYLKSAHEKTQETIGNVSETQSVRDKGHGSGSGKYQQSVREDPNAKIGLNDQIGNWDTTANMSDSKQEANNLEKLRASIYENDLRKTRQSSNQSEQTQQQSSDQSRQMPNQDLANIKPEERNPSNPIEEIKPIAGNIADKVKDTVDNVKGKSCNRYKIKL
ncbi:329_t:CDS:2 [Diversispora eburnea]|uniref:329_t:CDS:1 n=1 Tax=Diversispora eburnea TaxID=1213867 RepID=A0A9N9F4W0_9GLOM|nr:329_t:CDS:2 [Diversispora eburnea]